MNHLVNHFLVVGTTIPPELLPTQCHTVRDWLSIKHSSTGATGSSIYGSLYCCCSNYTMLSVSSNSVTKNFDKRFGSENS